jgi:CheY-like chemotaxis protein
MALTSLVVCAEARSVQVLSQILGELSVEVEHCGELATAFGRLTAAHFDAMIVDCSDFRNALQLIAAARQMPLNKGILTIGLVEGREHVRDVFGNGANFVVYKPVTVERAESSLRAARSLMKREKRGKLRISLHAPASIAYSDAEDVGATLLDLSEDGLAIQSERRLPPRCKVYFQFNLPGEKSLVRVSGDVVWQDSSGRVGIRFVDVPQSSRRTLNSWIKASLERQAELQQHRATPSEPAPLEPAPAQPSIARSPALGLSLSASNRRYQARHACRLSADVYRSGEGVPNRCTLSDISTGGCYVEMTSPFASQTPVEIVVRTSDMKLRVRGTVQTVHPGFGMGVQFNINTVRERDQVQQLIACQAAQSSEV